MKINEAGLNLIKSFEGLRLEAYKCPAGVWTIGYGHTGGVKQGQVISRMEADTLLLVDVAKFENHVSKYQKKYNWNENQFSALVSFAFNLGNIDQLTANGTRTNAQIAGKMLLYNRAGGKVLSGLTKRRQAERTLFLKPVQEIAPTDDKILQKPIQPPVEKVLFRFRIYVSALNIREDAGVTNKNGKVNKIVGAIKDKNVYSIVETKKAPDGGTWGRLSHINGWVNVSTKYINKV